MAELTNIESKLAEVLGLAQAAQKACDTVSTLLDGEAGVHADRLEKMKAEAVETEQRCTEIAAGLDGKKTAIEESARETKSEAQEMLDTYLSEESDALDGFEFLTMAEAGEVGHWEIVRQMADDAAQSELVELAEWAIPIQQRHFETVRECALDLAAIEDPLAVA